MRRSDWEACCWKNFPFSQCVEHKCDISRNLMGTWQPLFIFPWMSPSAAWVRKLSRHVCSPVLIVFFTKTKSSIQPFYILFYFLYMNLRHSNNKNNSSIIKIKICSWSRKTWTHSVQMNAFIKEIDCQWSTTNKETESTKNKQKIKACKMAWENL